MSFKAKLFTLEQKKQFQQELLGKLGALGVSVEGMDIPGLLEPAMVGASLALLAAPGVDITVIAKRYSVRSQNDLLDCLRASIGGSLRDEALKFGQGDLGKSEQAVQRHMDDFVSAVKLIAVR